VTTKQELEAFADFQDGDDVWIFTRRYLQDGRVELIRRGSGFTSVELLGIAALATSELVEQSRGTLEIDLITREALKKEEEKK
jgi:hypothetical protein